MINQIKEKITSDISRTGLSIIGVFSNGNSDFSYSIGGIFHNIPDVFCASLPSQQATYFLNQVFANIYSKNIPTDKPSLVYGLLKNNLPIACIPVEGDSFSILYENYMLQNENYLGTRNNVIQVVFPDPNAHFPWEDDFIPFYNEDEPICNMELTNQDFSIINCEELDVLSVFNKEPVS